MPHPLHQFQKNGFYLAVTLTFLVLLFYGLFLAHHINLSVADLGRHLKNGQVLFTDHVIPSTNFYSSTAPDFPVINHHWGSGGLFFLVWRVGGFAGLQLFFIALSLAALLLFFLIAARDAGFGPASLAALIALPLLAERTEIRPEVFSYLFSGAFFWLLLSYRRSKNKRFLLLLPLLELAWVNSHIYFFLGPALVGVFLAEDLILSYRASKRPDFALLWTLLATTAATFLNPFGIRGAVAPLTIFHNYGYMIAENQPVWFIEKILRNPNFTIFKIAFAILAAGFIGQFFAKDRRFFIPHTAIAIAMSALAWLATRNFALFGFFFIPLVCRTIAVHTQKMSDRHTRILAYVAASVIALLIIPALFGQWQKFFPYWHTFGLGIESGSSNAADFFHEQKIKGPIFNNYDIGGYLIFHLFPQERVFVDNRPEAYPAEFFTNVYIPMQEQEDIWQKELARWGFNAIFFSYRDATPWAQTFLAHRIKDQEWAPVFADRYALILLRRNEINKPVIERYELPQGIFHMTNTK